MSHGTVEQQGTQQDHYRVTACHDVWVGVVCGAHLRLHIHLIDQRAELQDHMALLVFLHKDKGK